MPRVLLADDSAVARHALKRRLARAHVELVERDSASAAASVDPRDLACVVLDFDLGDGTGLDVAERLRATASALPVAFFTSSVDDAAAARAEDFGPVFLKPDDLDGVVAWVEERLGAKR